MNTKAITMGIRRTVSGIIASAIAFSAIPTMAAEVENYPYTLFAASSEDGAITTTAYNFCVNGNVCTNGTIVANGNLNVNGTKTENAGQHMIYIFDKIDTKYFTTDNVDEHTEDYVLDELNINIDVPTEVLGETDLTGNININTALKSFEDINLFGEVKNTNDSVIYSKYGDIIIDSTNVNLNGLVYAPFGDVEITAQNLNLNNVVIIADSITLDCPNVNANYSTNAGELVGTVSEVLNIPKDEWQYMKDENGNGLPDFFEDIENWGKFADTDGDGLPDSIEEYLGSDANNIDTDNDGLNDYYEVFGTYTDPVLVDTDENGTTDGDEDFDKDSLTNHEEFLNETYPYTDDTDCDGLSDGDEFNVYNTDPLTSDTDGEGLLDGDEIVLGTDPLVQDTDADGTLDCDEKFNQIFTHKVANEDCAVTEVLVTMDCTGNINRTTAIESVMGKDYLCTEVVGLVGEPFEIKTTSEFDTATITFKLDTEKLGEDEFDNLLFLWYDEENDEFVELETIYDEENSAVSIVTTHFSKYMVVNKLEWFEAWRNTPSYPSASDIPIDTILVIDESGSMSNSDIKMATDAASCYIATMREGDRAAIIAFSSSANVMCHLTDETNKLLNALSFIHAGGGTDFNKAISNAILEFDDAESKKMIIFMSDGQASVSNDVLTSIKSSDIIINTVGLGSANQTVLREIAKAGNGLYYYAITADELSGIYEEISMAELINSDDTDSDGLYDVYETQGMMMSNRKVIYTDPLKTDTDGDGLTDGEEIKLSHYDIENKAWVFKMITNPLAGDYQDSGVCDYDRVNNTNVYGTSYLISVITGLEAIDAPVGTIAYAYPNSISGEAFAFRELNSPNEHYYAKAVVYANGEYWLKVQSRDLYGVWGYILVDNKSENSFNYLIQNNWLWKLSHGDVKVPYFCNAACSDIKYQHTNEAGRADKIEIDERLLIYILDSCNKVKSLYCSSTNLGQNGDDIKRIISKYLTPELIIAISGTESGYFLTTEGGGLGLTPGGVKYIGGMIGAEGLSTNFDDYEGDLKNSIYAGTVMIANNIKYSLQNQSYSVYDHDGNVLGAQVLFNAFYFYGSGTNTRNYYGYMNNGEAGMSSGYKMYIYSTICEQVGSKCAIQFGEYDARISALTWADGKNRWKYTFSEDKLY